MRPSEIIDRERRWALAAAIGAFAVAVLFIISRVIASGADIGTVEDRADIVTAYAEESQLVTADVIGGVGIALLAIPLVYLFLAADARSDRVRRGMIGLAAAGPILYGASVFVQGLAFADAGDTLLAAADPCVTDECVNELIANTSISPFATGLSIAGALGLAAGMLYTNLNAMRVGLLTRFLGTFGMATGVLVFLGPFFGLPFGSLFIVFYAVALGLLYQGWRPGGKPPAWEKGEAVALPPPGQARQEQRPEPEDVEGRADEIFPEAAASTDSEPEEDRPEPGSIADEVDRASRKAEEEGEGGPQKRKRRS